MPWNNSWSGGGAIVASSVQVIDINGAVVASIDPTGNIVGQSISAVNSLLYQGTELQTLLDAKPRGLVASGALLSAASGSGITTEIGIGEVDFTQVAGRDYKVTLDGLNWSCQTALAVAQINLRITTDGSVPTITSQLLEAVIQPAVNLNQALTAPPMMPMGTYSAVDGALIRVLLTIQRLAGTGTLSWNTYGGTVNQHGIRLYVEDVGLDVGPDTFILNNGGGGVIPGKNTYTTTWFSTGVQSYQSNNTHSIANGNNTLGYQGDGSAVGNPGGNSASQFMFDWAAIRAALSGATILHTYIFTKNTHTYFNSGATARVGTHNNATLPTLFAAANQRRWNQSTSEGGSVWSGDVGVGLGQEFQSGATNGFTLGYSLGTASQKLADYGTWSQMGVKITYQK